MAFFGFDGLGVEFFIGVANGVGTVMAAPFRISAELLTGSTSSLSFDPTLIDLCFGVNGWNIFHGESLCFLTEQNINPQMKHIAIPKKLTPTINNVDITDPGSDSLDVSEFKLSLAPAFSESKVGIDGSGVGDTDGDTVGSAVVGEDVGLSVGDGVGSSVGSGVGLRLGQYVGAGVGLSVGAGVGSLVGAGVGAADGAFDGISVGDAVGLPVGAGVGDIDGLLDGPCVGLVVGNVGPAVGFLVGAPDGVPVGTLVGAGVG
mmetsp:Transcript_53077/g.47719  ORF Transcript_53077/g.47719 Transcript_53077/m.47719 type:complete len:260 (-) Transcript_53077:739-1518(-)